MQNITCATLDLNVQVDRSVRMVPNWAREEMIHPEFKLDCRPVSYNLQTGVGQWLHDSQKGDIVRGSVIFDYLVRTKRLPLCLNWQDGLAIQKKGLSVFLKLFSGNSAVFLWGSPFKDNAGKPSVPCLFRLGSEVGLDRRLVSDFFCVFNPALCFNNGF